MSTQDYIEFQLKRLRKIARKHNKLMEYSPMAASAYSRGELKDKDVEEFREILNA